MNAPEIPYNCPQCGTNKAASDFAGAYRCGTLVSSSGRFYHTGTCRSFSELRKPIDKERDQLSERVKRLEEAGRELARRHLLAVVTYPQALADVAAYEKAIQ